MGFGSPRAVTFAIGMTFFGGCTTPDSRPSDTESTAIRSPAAPAHKSATVVSPTETSAATTNNRWHYTIRPSTDLSTIAVRVCFPGHLPERFDAQMPAARWSLRHARRYPGGDTLTQAVSGLDLSSMRAGDCIDYALDLHEVARRADDRRNLRAVQSDLYISPDYWLWRPFGDLDRVTLTASFDLPPGMEVAIPWPNIDHDDRYRILPSTFYWTVPAAFGAFSSRTLKVDTTTHQARLRVAILGDNWNIPLDRLYAWIHRAGRAVTRLNGAFPVDTAQVILMPYPGDNIGFGYATQGGGAGVRIQVGVDTSQKTLDADWVAVHELLHLGTPVMDAEDRWLSEGLSTYYEPLLRAKAGIITAHKAWELLHDGYLRGSSRGSERTLREECRDMDETHQYWRVYWSGAAIAFMADVAARRAGSSLDTEVQALRACCLGTERSHPLDELLGNKSSSTRSRAPHLQAVVSTYVDSRRFPDYQAAYRALGLSFDDRGKVTLSANPVAKRLREQMTGPESATEVP